MLADPQPTDTLGASVYRRLREDIVFGRLAPETKLRLEQLRGRYDVSVATLREVLPRLVTEGLIRFETQKGFEVAPVSAGDLAEIAEMRLLLEGHAIGGSFARGDLDWEADLVAAHHRLSRMEARMLDGDRSVSEDWKRYDRQFHRALVSACGSAQLLTAYEKIFDRFLRYQVLLVMFRGRAAVDEHARLLDCALRRDAQGALAVLAAHVGACVDDMVTRQLGGGAR
ncbi:FCD domain-containing protein [Frigidibacter sp. MR17.14]|uniref:GntR family transcriptional regulator n=1 Tax=Frigidibacter sp. MR17.14 TaxID=3126509 RepID=UPI003012C235